MRTKHTFRPVVNDRLEDRAVPSGGLEGALGAWVSVPARDAVQVAQAFREFERTYSQNVRTVLLRPGTTDLAAARTAFDQATLTELGKLNTKLDGIVNNLPTNADLDRAFQTALLSTTPPASPDTSLQATLAALPTPADTSFRSTRSFLREGLGAIVRQGEQLVRLVRTAPAPTGSIDAQTLRDDLRDVRTAFRTFQQAHADAVRNVLLPAGTTDPAANRAAFDAAVLSALQRLSTDVTTAVNDLPASVTATLNTTLRNRLLATTPPASPDTSLQGRLAAIATPRSARGLATMPFRARSFAAIAWAEGQVVRDITQAVSQYNSSLG